MSSKALYVVPRAASGLPETHPPQGVEYAGLRAEGSYIVLRYVGSTSRLAAQPDGSLHEMRDYLDRYYVDGREIVREEGELCIAVAEPKRGWWTRLFS